MSLQRVSRREFLRLSAVSAAALLAACAPSAGPAAPAAPAAPAEGEAAAPAQAAGKVLLKYQSREPEMAGGVLQLWNTFYPKFQEEHPDIEVEFLPFAAGGNFTETVMAQMVAGNAPDVTEMCCWESTYFVQKKQTLNLQPLIDRDAEEVNMDDYYEHQFDPWKDEEGNIHLMPRFTGTQVVYFNKDWFDKKGIPYPPQEWGGWTFDQYLEIGRQFVSRETPPTFGTSNYGLTANWLTQYWLRGWGANMVDPKDNTHCPLDAKEAQECLEVIRKMIWDDHAFAIGAEMGGMGCEQLFIGERIAMLEMGPWNLGPIAEGARFKWDVAPMPDGPAGHTTHQSVDGSFIWNKTPYPEQSWTLLKGLTSPWYGELYAQFAAKQPSRKSVLPKFAELLRKQNPIFENVKLEVFMDATYKNIGMPEEMFKEDKTSKSDILQPVFDVVMTLGKGPVTLIAQAAEVVTQFNRGEIKVEDIGAKVQAITG